MHATMNLFRIVKSIKKSGEISVDSIFNDEDWAKSVTVYPVWPQSVPPMLQNGCVFSIMAYMSLGLCGGWKDRTDYMADYLLTYSADPLQGVQSIYIDNFIRRHFIVDPFASYKSCVSTYHGVMTLHSLMEGIYGHCIAVIGYDYNSDTYFIMDPAVGHQQVVSLSYLSNLSNPYCYSIRACR